MLNEAETSISCALGFVSRVFIYVVVLRGINGWNLIRQIIVLWRDNSEAILSSLNLMNYIG